MEKSPVDLSNSKLQYYDTNAMGEVVLTGYATITELAEDICRVRDNNLDRRFALRLFHNSNEYEIPVPLAHHPADIERRFNEMKEAGERKFAQMPMVQASRAAYFYEEVHPAQKRLNETVRHAAYPLSAFPSHIEARTQEAHESEVTRRKLIVAGLQWLDQNPEMDLRRREHRRAMADYFKKEFGPLVIGNNPVSLVQRAREQGWEQFTSGYGKREQGRTI